MRNRPTPTFSNEALRPAIVAMTEATFDDVTTLPETVWPDDATGVLISMPRICGGACGRSRIGDGRTGAAVATDCAPASTLCRGVARGRGLGVAVPMMTGDTVGHPDVRTGSGTCDAAAALGLGFGLGLGLAGGAPRGTNTTGPGVFVGWTCVVEELEHPAIATIPSAKHSSANRRLRSLLTKARAMESTHGPVLSIVVPLMDEEGNVRALLDRIFAIATRLHGAPSFEVILVNDGSRDNTLGVIREQMRTRSNIVLVNLSRNFGHQLAATAGLDVSRGEAVVLMDGDLQDPPELIEAFLQKWREGYDVVYAIRRQRKGESAFKLLTARLFYRTIKRLTNVSIPVDTGDFRLMSRRVVEALKISRERHRFLRGMVSWTGFNQTGVEYDRDERTSGRTKYPFRKMLRFALDGITSFSDVPLRFASYLGFTVSTAAFIYAVVIILAKALRLGTPEYARGWASTMVVILFLGGVQLIGIGILGEYLGRIYDEVKGRPLYLIADVERS